MNIEELKKIVAYLVEQGLDTIINNTNENQATIDYVAVFSKDQNEFLDMGLVAELMGKEVDKETAKTGRTFLLHEPLSTSGGTLSFLKIRKPDATRPQRGAPDFKITDYQQFKDKYLQSSGNFTLMIRRDYEMIEIKGVDVLVYIPSKTVSERMGKIK